MDLKQIEKAVKIILAAIGEDPDRDGLRETPARVARMYEEIFSGITTDPAKEIKIFHEGEHEEMIMVKDIPFYSVCEHHLVPFIGKAHVAYIPTKGKVTGLSKLVRVVEGFAKRLQVQERLTSQIADTLMEIGHEIYSAELAFYQSVAQAAKRDVPKVPRFSMAALVPVAGE